MRIRTLSFLVGTLALGLAAGPTAGQNAEQQHAAGQQAPGMMSMHGAAMQGAMQRMQQGMDMPSSGNQDVDFARMRAVRLSRTVYCHKGGLVVWGALRQRWMVAGWTLKVRATSLMDLPSWTSARTRAF